MDYWKDKIIRFRFILLLLFIYFPLHLTNLTLLPIFNDEAIYLDWGWFNTHSPGHLYDSLLDAKQPLMIWIFGFFENFFTDPLFAGRFVSVLIGSVTTLGIYTVAKKLFNKNIAFIASILFSIVPIFVFYNRQALLESAIACVGIWSFFALLNLITKPTTRSGALLGVIFGIGFFIKSSSLLFIVAASLIIFFSLLKKRKTELTKPYFLSVLSFFGVTFLLFINPTFWQTFSTNSRYSFTLSELFTLPFSAWMSHLIGFFEIGFIFMTPFIFVAAIIGMYTMQKNKLKNHQIFIFYFVFALALEIFSAKFQNQRYLVSFLPFLVIPAAYVLNILWKINMWMKALVMLSICISFLFSLMLIFNPESYILQLSKISKYSEMGYIRGQTSGYGINETIQYIKEHSSPTQPSMVLFGLNIGNPESAVDVYSQKHPQLFALHIDSQFFPDIAEYQCLTSNYPIFLVTRNDQLFGMDRYFVLEKSFVNPDKKNYVGIYTLKKNCTGKTLSLSDIYQGAIDKIQYMKTGY